MLSSSKEAALRLLGEESVEIAVGELVRLIVQRGLGGR